THEKEALLSDLDPQRISELIFRLHEDGKLADSLSKEAREFARTRLDKKIWEKIYHDILLGREAQIRQPFGFIGAADKPSSDSIVETGRDRQLKILFLVSPSMLAMGRTRHRLNRILMEMAERNHIIYLAYPHTASPKFIACQNIIHLIYTSETVAKEQIQQIAPDVVMLSSKNTERLVFYTLVQKMNIPVVFLDFFYSVLYDGDPKFPSTLDHAVVAFEEEIALSCGTMILTDQEIYFQRFTPSVGKKVSLYPNMVADGAASSEPAIENRTMNPKTIFFSKEKITVAEWEKQKKIAFDHIEEEILTAAGQTGNHENPERVEGLKLILDSLKEMDGKNKKLERELALLKNSYGFRIGQTFVDAISKPGKNTILFPWRFIKLAVSYLFKR
ncbi:MAG: hypothetical protein GY729_06800, partial [Desulfobacteraceae bacterium]|nr:hypothetical protein [Desulfobacteraceae bacterium]